MVKAQLRKAFSPILRPFEAGDGEYRYKWSHRAILIAVGALFLLLAAGSLAVVFYAAQPGAWLPFGVFFSAGFVCVVVGWLGSDRAVARIWGNR